MARDYLHLDNPRLVNETRSDAKDGRRGSSPGMITRLQTSMVAIFRAMPRIRGRGRAAAILNRQLLKLGAPPLVTTTMREGYRLILDARNFAQARALYDGDYDAPNIAALRRFIRPGGVVLDVGANIGLWTLALAKTAREVGAHVAAFEPLPPNAKRLQENVVLNAADDVVTVYAVALGDDCGSITLTFRDFQEGSDTGNAAIRFADGHDADLPHTAVPIKRFDDVWTGGRIDAIKLDIEGHEDLFLAGAREMLRSDRPPIMMEMCRGYYRRRGIDLDAQLFEWLPIDYCAFKVTARRITAVISLSEIPELQDVLLVPQERLRLLMIP